MDHIPVVIATRQGAIRIVCRRALGPARDIRVVAEARSLVEAMAATVHLGPHVLLLNLRWTRPGGTALLRVIEKRRPRAKVLLVAEGAPEPRILKALACGACGYLEEEALPRQLPKAIQAVTAGEAWVPRRMVTGILDRLVKAEVRHGTAITRAWPL